MRINEIENNQAFYESCKPPINLMLRFDRSSHDNTLNGNKKGIGPEKCFEKSFNGLKITLIIHLRLFTIN